MVTAKHDSPSESVKYHPQSPMSAHRLLKAVLLIWAILTIASSPQVAAQDSMSQEHALHADLAEAIQMLEKQQVEMLIYDFMPAELVNDLRRVTTKRYGEDQTGTTVMSAFTPAMRSQLVSELKAAQSGKKTWNRDKSIAWIQFTTKPIEVVPAQKPGSVPEIFGTVDELKGLGPDADEVLAKAIGLLESKRYAEFARAMLPAKQAAALVSEVAMDRWLHRLRQHPTMVEAMIRDLKLVKAGKNQQAADRAIILYGPPGVTLHMEKLVGSWRLAGLSASQQAEYEKLANTEIAARIMPARKGTLVLAFSEGRWRLMAMPTRIPSMPNAPSER